MKENSRQQLIDDGKEYFTEVYRAHYAPIFRFIFARVKNQEITSDLVQDVFVKAYIPIQRDDEQRTPLPLLYTIARNVLIDFYRKKKDQPIENVEIELYTDGLESDAPSLAREQKILIGQALALLSEDQRTVITLSYMEELSIAEVAQIMSKSEEAIRQIKSRAQKQLKKYLENYG